MSVTELEVPIGVPSEGTVSAWFVPAGGLTDPAAPTVAELTPGGETGVVNLTALISPTAPTASVARNSKRRIGSKRAFELFGSETWTVEALEYPYDVQPAGEGEGDKEVNAAYAALTPGSNGYLVFRWGVDSATEVKAGEIVDVFEVTRLGPQVKQPPAENDELMVQQELTIGTVWHDVEVQSS